MGIQTTRKSSSINDIKPLPLPAPSKVPVLQDINNFKGVLNTQSDEIMLSGQVKNTDVRHTYHSNSDIDQLSMSMSTFRAQMGATPGGGGGLFTGGN